MKKKFVYLFAVLSLTLTLCGCGSKKEDSTGVDDKTTTKTQEKQESKDTKVKQIGAAPLYVSVPSSWKAEDYGYSFILSDSKDYAILVQSNSEEVTGSDLKENFLNLYNETSIGVLMQFYHCKYSSFSPSNYENVKINGKIEALKFNDNQPVNDYGTETTFPVYGYTFTYNNYPVIVSSIVLNSSTDESKVKEMNNYVDEIVKTIRTEK